MDGPTGVKVYDVLGVYKQMAKKKIKMEGCMRRKKMNINVD